MVDLEVRTPYAFIERRPLWVIALAGRVKVVATRLVVGFFENTGLPISWKVISQDNCIAFAMLSPETKYNMTLITLSN